MSYLATVLAEEQKFLLSFEYCFFVCALTWLWPRASGANALEPRICKVNVSISILGFGIGFGARVQSLDFIIGDPTKNLSKVDKLLMIKKINKKC